MRKILYIMCMLVMIFTSCEKQDLPTGGNEEVFTLKLSTEQSFMGEEPQPMGKVMTRTTDHIDNYMVGVWHDDDFFRVNANIFDDGEGGKTNFATSTTGQFEMTLDRSKDYYFAFWADGGNGTYYFTGGAAMVYLNEGKSTEEAFAGKYVLLAGDKFNGNITLKRAVAKVSLRNTGAIEASKSIELKYRAYTDYDIGKSMLSGTASDVSTTLTTTAAEAGEEFASVWLLAPDREFRTNFTYNYEGEGENTVENVPYQANRRTNLKGEYYAPIITYAIGDPYPDATNPIGVVFEIENGGVNGKIVSLDETAKAWQPFPPAPYTTGANDLMSGLENMKSVIALHPGFSEHPALEWVHNRNAGATADTYTEDAKNVWYLPAFDELRKIYRNNYATDNAIDNALSTHAPLTDAYYWSSTERSTNEFEAEYVDFSSEK